MILSRTLQDTRIVIQENTTNIIYKTAVSVFKRKKVNQAIISDAAIKWLYALKIANHQLQAPRYVQVKPVSNVQKNNITFPCQRIDGDIHIVN